MTDAWTTETPDHTEHIILLQRILRRIKKDPEHWRQADYVTALPSVVDERGVEVGEPSCGTSYCFAGWSVALTEGRLLNDMTVEVSDDYPQRYSYDTALDGTRIYGAGIAEWAEEKLGLTGLEANELFRASNTLDELRQQVAAITSRMLDEMDPPPEVAMPEWKVWFTRTSDVLVTAADDQEAIRVARELYDYSDLWMATKVEKVEQS